MEKKNLVNIGLAVLISFFTLIIGLLGGYVLFNYIQDNKEIENIETPNGSENSNNDKENEIIDKEEKNDSEIPSKDKLAGILKASQLMEQYKLGNSYFRFDEVSEWNIKRLILSDVSLKKLESCDEIFNNPSEFDDIEYLRESCKLLEYGYSETKGMTEVYSYNDLLDIKKDLFGPKSTLEKKDFSVDFTNFVYVNKLNSFVAISCNCGADGPSEKTYIREYIYDAKEDGNNFYVYIKSISISEILDEETWEVLPNKFSTIEKKYKYAFVRNKDDWDGYYLSAVNEI